jgi:hypothetical protein
MRSSNNQRGAFIMRLKSVHGVITDKELLDLLQGNGAVSDNAVTLDDVPEPDLVRPYNATFEKV